MYKRMKVRIPSKTHDKLKLLITQDKKIPVKIGLEEGDDELLLTPGQILKMHHAKNDGKKSIILRFSRKQVRANLHHEGGFLATLMSMAAKVLPTLLTGLATGVLSGLTEKAISGSGLYLGKKGRGVSKITMVEGGGLYLSPLFYPEDEDYDGIWLKNENETFKGAGLILGKDSPFRNIPILGWLL